MQFFGKITCAQIQKSLEIQIRYAALQEHPTINTQQEQTWQYSLLRCDWPAALHAEI